MKKILDKPFRVILYSMILLLTMINGDPRFIDSSNSNHKEIVKASPLTSDITIDYEQPLYTKYVPVKHIFTERELIEINVREISSKYKVDPELIMSIIEHESDFNPNCKTGVCVGLMQINPKYHSDRAEKLGVRDLYDPYGNILVGVDYISELIRNNGDPTLALMLYYMNHKKAYYMYRNGNISTYAKQVLSGMEKYKKGD